MAPVNVRIVAFGSNACDAMKYWCQDEGEKDTTVEIRRDIGWRYNKTPLSQLLFNTLEKLELEMRKYNGCMTGR